MRASRPPSRRSSSKGPSSSAMTVSPGAPVTSAMWSSAASGCATPRTACCGCSRASTCPGRRPGRSIPRPIRWRRSGSKSLAQSDAKGRRTACRGGAGRALVHGRGPDRTEGSRHPRLVPERCAAARAARAPLCLSPPVRRRLPGARYRRGAGPARGLDRRDEPLPGRTRRGRAGQDPRRLVLDRAGWHVSEKLSVPANLTLVHLPPYSPELNPVERVWLYLRERWLSHRVLAGGCKAVLDAACTACNALLAEPGRLRSLTSYPWLTTSVTTS